MSSSGQYVFNPTIAEAIDEAWERCGKNPEDLTAEHVKSALRSLNYMLQHWSNLSLLQWTIDLQTQTTSVGMESFTPPTGTIDLLDVTLLRNGYETPMTTMSRDEYHAMPNKDAQGMPNRFYVQRAITPVVYIWPAGENATDVIRYYRIRRIQDTGVMSNTADIPSRYQDAFAAGLASRMAQKFAPDRVVELYQMADRTLSEARSEDRERAEMRLSVRIGQYGRGRL